MKTETSGHVHCKARDLQRRSSTSYQERCWIASEEYEKISQALELCNSQRRAWDDCSRKVARALNQKSLNRQFDNNKGQIGERTVYARTERGPIYK